MVRTRTLMILVAILLLMLGLLLFFYFYVLNGSNGTVQTEGMQHLFSIYGWGDRPDELLKKPTGVAADSDGNIYVTLPSRGRVVVFDKDGNFIRVFGHRGMEPGSLRGPLGIAVDSKRNRIYVADRERFRLVIFDRGGKFLNETKLMSPIQPCVAKDRVYLTTFGPIAILSPDGKILDTWGARSRSPGGFDFAHGISVDSHGDVFVADTNNTRLVGLNRRGTVLWIVGRPPKAVLDPRTGINLPAGLAIDDKERLFVVDTFDYSIKAFNTRGQQLATFGGGSGNLEGQFNMPDGIAYMGNQTFAIADKYNDRVQVVRLTLPGEESPFSGFPWWALLLIPLLILLLRRKKFIVNEDFMELVIGDQKLRLLSQVAKHLQVSQEVFEKFADYQEEGLKFTDVVSVRPYPKEKIQELMDKHDIEEDTATFLALSSKKLYEKLKFDKFTLAFEDDKVREVLEENNKKPPKMINYQEFIDKYDVQEEEAAPQPG